MHAVAFPSKSACEFARHVKIKCRTIQVPQRPALIVLSKQSLKYEGQNPLLVIFIYHLYNLIFHLKLAIGLKISSA